MIDKKILILGILIGVALISYSVFSYFFAKPINLGGNLATGTVVTTSPTQGTSNAYDCGTDIYCFNSRASKCTPVKVRTDVGSSTATVLTITNEVRDGTLEECTTYVKVEDVTIQKSADLQTKGYALNLVGKDMLCTLAVSQINEPTNYLNRCAGNLKVLLEQGLFATS